MLAEWSRDDTMLRFKDALMLKVAEKLAVIAPEQTTDNVQLQWEFLLATERVLIRIYIPFKLPLLHD